MRDHTGLVVNKFQGLFDRGEDEVVPAGYFINSLNWEFLREGLRTRGGMIPDNVSATIPVDTKYRRIELYERTGEAQRLLMLDDAGQIWDSVTGLVILNIPTMIDFSVTIMYDRAFISPHNGKTGLPGQKIYLYEGSDLARPAAGVGPSKTSPMNGVHNAVGSIEAGDHWYGIAFESASGYLSPIGSYIARVAPGDRSIDLTIIPTGPAGTTARVIVATKTIITPAAPENLTWYFVPNGRIPDNTSTSKTVDFYDADLMDEASHLLEQLAEIPAGVGIGQYKARLMVWGEDANPAIIRLSAPGEPENHNGADGYLTIYPGVGAGVKNCVEYRNQLLIFKSHRTYYSLDNDDVPATWDVGEVDASVGTECHGIGQILNIGANVEDRVFIADTAGLRIFTGTFTDDGIITYNVDDVWARITKSSFHNVEISIDAINFRIYVALPLDGATTPTHILYGDYNDGLGENTMRWDLWKFPVRPTSIVVALIDSEPVFKFGSLDGKIAKQDPMVVLDFGQIIENFCQFPLYPIGDVDEVVNHYTGIMLRARGAGLVSITGSGLDDSSTMQASSIFLSLKPGKPYFIGFNFTSEHLSIRLTQASPAGFIILTKFILYVSVVWESRAQV